MKPAELRRIENEEQADIVRQRRLLEFKEKNKKLAKEIESKDFQLWYESVMGQKIGWPDVDIVHWKAYFRIWIDRAFEVEQWQKDRLNKHKRHYIQALATPAWRNKEKIKELYAYRDKMCEIHGQGAYHVDHIVPIQGEKVCGLHCEFNLQVITAHENKSKNNTHTA